MNQFQKHHSTHYRQSLSLCLHRKQFMHPRSFRIHIHDKNNSTVDNTQFNGAIKKKIKTFWNLKSKVDKLVTNQATANATFVAKHSFHPKLWNIYKYFMKNSVKRLESLKMFHMKAILPPDLSALFGNKALKPVQWESGSVQLVLN